jgi:phenylacetate-CoA ligase
MELEFISFEFRFLFSESSRMKQQIKIWNPEFECMDQGELKELQTKRLRKQIENVYHNVPYYAEKMKEAGVQPEDIKTLGDVSRLPITTKEDLRQNYPYGTFALPLKDVIRIHASTGTTGKPTVVGYTRNDLDAWTECVARFLVAGGLTDEEVVQIAFGYGLFTGGFGLHYGSEKVGATVIPAASGNTERQLMLMKDLGTTAIVCTPSYAVYLAEAINKYGFNRYDLKLKYGFFGGEFWTNAIREKIEKGLGIIATDNYGLSEITGPGVCGECLCQNGMHISEDYFLVEVVDPETLESLPDGEKGEVVITTLTKEAIPVIRYRTRDISRIINEPCECGRTTRRMEKVIGRTDDMLILRGVNVFPSQVEHVLLQFVEAEPHYQLTIDRVKELDTVEIRVEVSDKFFHDEMNKMIDLRDRLQRKIEGTLGIKIKLILVESGSLERFTGKAKRVIDKREFMKP